MLTNLNLCLCGNFRITPNPGGALENECLNVAPNFIFGYIFLVVAVILLFCYILGYSYQEVVHRIESVIEPANKISRRVVLSEWAQKKAKKEHMREVKTLDVYVPVYIQCGRRLLRAVYVCIAQLLMLVFCWFSIAFFVFFLLLRTFYCSIIIWRGQLPFHFNVIDAIDEFVKGLYFIEITMLFYPFIYVYKFLSFFQINLGGIDVTCSGAQLPLVLVTDLVVFTICLSITCTDFQAYADMFADVAGNWAAGVRTHDESDKSEESEESELHCCDVLVSRGLSLASHAYPDMSFGAIKGIHEVSLASYAYYTIAYLVWLIVTISTAAICLVVDALHMPHMIFRAIWTVVKAKFAYVFRKTVSALLSFTPLQRCEFFY